MTKGRGRETTNGRSEGRMREVVGVGVRENYREGMKGRRGIVDFNFTSKYFIKLSVSNSFVHFCLRPYHGETTGSRLISEVKHRRAWVVLGWVTTWEVRVL